MITDDGQLPTSAKRLLKTIDKNEWSGLVQTTRGPLLSAKNVDRIVDCTLVSLTSISGGGACAVFLDDKFWQGLVWVWCKDPDCDNDEPHPFAVPEVIGYRDLCRLVSEVEL